MCIRNRLGRRIQPQAEALALNSVALIILPSDLIANFHQAISDLDTELIPIPIAQIHKIIQGRGDAENGRRGERIQTGIETPPEFKRLKSSISVGVSDPWDLRPRVAASPRLRVFFDEPIAKALASLTKTDQFEQLLALTKSRAS